MNTYRVMTWYRIYMEARRQAETRYRMACDSLRAAEVGSSIAAYELSFAEWNSAKDSLVQAEIEAPTLKESRSRSNLLRLRNRGMDI